MQVAKRETAVIKIDSPVVLSKLLNPFKGLLQVTPLELELFETYSNWTEGARKGLNHDFKDKYDLVPQLFLLLAVVKRSLLAFLGILVLHLECPQVLVRGINELTTERVRDLYNYSFNHFDHTVQLVTKLLAKQEARNLGEYEVMETLYLQKFMLSVVWGVRMMKLVDLETLLGFMRLVRGARELMAMAEEMAPKTLDDCGGFETNDAKAPILPWFTPYFDAFGECEDPELETSLSIFRLLNNLWYEACSKNSDTPVCKMIMFANPSWFDGIYDENFLALSALNVWCSQILIIGFYFDRKTTMTYEYMQWYRDYNFTRFGRWYFEHERHLYNCVIENGLRVKEQELLAVFIDFEPEKYVSCQEML